MHFYLVKKILSLGFRGIAWSIKCLPYKLKDLGLISGHRQNLGIMSHDYKPSAGAAKTGEFGP